MSDTSSFLGDVGNFFGDIGSSISSGVSSAYNSLFGNSTPSATSSDSFSVAPSGNAASGQTVGPSATPSSTADISQFFGASPSSTSPMSAIATPGNTAPGNDFSYTNAGANPATPSSAGAPPSSTQSILDSLGIGKVNPIGALASTGALAYNLIEGSPTQGAEKSLKNIAAGQNAQGQQLESYLANGTLPPGAQQWVSQQTAAQSAAIKAKYAQLGMSGSTAETQELNNVQTQAQTQMFQIASSLLNTGITETDASGTLYNYLMTAQNADSKEVSGAIQNFVSSLAGGGSGGAKSINLNLGGSS